MTSDIFDFWSKTSSNPYIHSTDERVFKRTNHNFASDCVPQAYRGRLRAAPVVLLFLSPGLDAKRDPAHCETVEGRDYYARQRTGECDLPSDEEHPSAYEWLVRIVKQFEINYEQARSKIATLNICAYKSERFTDHHMLAALPSSRATIDWAQSKLFPEAEAGKRTVVCLRSAKYWGLRVGESRGSLFCPPHSRSGIMRHGDMRLRTVASVRQAVLGKQEST